MVSDAVRIAIIIVIGVISVVAIAAVSALEITDHGSEAGIILGFVTTLTVSLIALVNSAATKASVNGTLDRLDKLEEKTK